MGWSVSAMADRRELIALCSQEGANVSDLARRWDVSRSAVYKWLRRAEDPQETFEDRSRRPHHSPNRTAGEIEERIVAIRDAHPQWNARKLRRVLQREIDVVPAASTIGEILRRNGRVREAASAAAQRWQRFEHSAANDMWQADFKGHFPTGRGRCHPLTALDDHSRYAVILEACTNERGDTVRAHLIDAFRRYGMPLRINFDNGNPWGNASGAPWTQLTVWLLERGVRVSHSSPYHPQTNGKDERFHRTLKAEVLGSRWFSSIDEVALAFDAWREVYNHERPHEALELDVPADRYRPSIRTYPEHVPPFEYDVRDLVRKVKSGGEIMAWGRRFYISEAFTGRYVALRPTAEDGVWDVHFHHQRIGSIDRRSTETGEKASANKTAL